MAFQILDPTAKAQAEAATTQPAQRTPVAALFGGLGVTVRYYAGATLAETATHDALVLDALTPRGFRLGPLLGTTVHVSGATITHAIWRSLAGVDVLRFEAADLSPNPLVTQTGRRLNASDPVLPGVVVTADPDLPVAPVQTRALTLDLDDTAVAGAAAGGSIVNTGTQAEAWSVSPPAGITVTPSSGTLAAGATQNLSVTAAAAGTFSLALVAAGATITGTPQVIVVSEVVAGAPTSVASSGPADWTTNTAATVTYTLNSPADQPYTIEASVTGGSIVGPTTRTIAAGRKTVDFAVHRDDEGEVVIDYTISPPLSRAGRNRPVYFTHMPQVEGFTDETLNLERMVWPEPWLYGGSTYMRYQVVVEWGLPTATIRLERGDLRGGVPADYRPAKTYTLLVDDVAVASADAVAGQRYATFGPFSTAGIASGWRRIKIGGLSDGETSPTFFAFMRRAGDSAPKRIPVAASTYEMEQRRGGGNRHAWGWMPAAYAPKPAPLAARTWEYFGGTTVDGLVAVPLTAMGHYPPHVPNLTASGVVSSFNMQGYFWDDFIQKYPRTILMDGPRGVGMLAMCAHIGLATATVRALPGSPLVTQVYALDPWRMCRKAADGTITTLVGYRHRPTGGYFADSPKPGNTTTQPTLELVGDWSAIPVERRGFHELWGLAWLPSTVVVDPGLPLIDDNGVLREQHPLSPSALLTDTQNNRIARVTFHPTDRSRAPVVTEWLTGLGDPWGIAHWYNGTQHEILISERTNNRIVAYSEDGVFLRTIVQRDPGLPGTAPLSYLRKAVISGSLAEARAQPCLAPEDLVVMDDWLYWGSYAQRQVRRVHLVTGVVEVFADLDPYLDGNSAYVKIAVSDGTFFQRHAVAVASWSVATPPITGLFLPGGGRINLASMIGAMDANGYGAAVAIGHGRMLFGLSDYGITEIRKGTKADTALFETGRTEFKSMAGPVRYGDAGFGSFGQALPWGQSEALDYYLEVMGHTRPEGA